jgi:hypothetical protein
MSRNATHTFDGLVVGYGTHSEDNEVASVYQGSDGVVTVIQEIVTAATSVTYPNASGQQHVIPRGSVFLGGEVTCLVPVTGAGADFDIGTWSRGLATEVVDDANGLVDALLLAEFANIGDTSILDGVLIADSADSGVAVAGATSNSDVVITYEFETAMTGGRLRVVVRYRPPTGSSGRTLAV